MFLINLSGKTKWSDGYYRYSVQCFKFMWKLTKGIGNVCNVIDVKRSNLYFIILKKNVCY